MGNEVKYDFNKLAFFIKQLMGDCPKVQVGILGDTNGRKDGKTNAEIGLANEFGKLTGFPKIPKRSFILMPLNTHFKELLKEKKSTSAEAFERAVKTGNLVPFMKKVGMVAEETIQTAFETRGWGQWPDNAPYTIAMKGSDSPLIDTGELRKSITSKVKGKNK